jgi:hypothetical protein
MPVKRARAGGYGTIVAELSCCMSGATAWPPILAWRPRLLARDITGIRWRPLTSMAGSFGRNR